MRLLEKKRNNHYFSTITKPNQMDTTEITEIEKIILGEIILEPKCADIAMDWIADKQNFFTDPHVSVAWWAVTELKREDRHIDIVTVNAKCRTSPNEIGAAMAFQLAQMTNRVASSKNIKTHLLLLTDNWIRRTATEAAELMLARTQSEKSDVFEVVAQIERSILELNRQIFPVVQKEIGTLLSDIVHKIVTSADTGVTSGCSSGFRDFDNIHGAFMPGTLSIVAGRPAMGKTSFVMNIARNISKRGVLVLVFSIEMSAEELACRLLSMETEIPNNYIYRNPERLELHEKQRIGSMADGLKKATIKIIDEGRQTMSSIRNTAKRYAQDGKIGCIIIDYLQIITPDTKEHQQNDVKFYADTTRDIKILAKGIGVPVVLLSQLSRANEHLSDKRPTLNTLRGSGGIEENADSVTFVYRPSYYEADKPAVEDCFAIVAKNRNGAIGDVPLRFIPKYTKFTDANAYEDNFNPTINPSMLYNARESTHDTPF